ncbi:L-azetidine-2-carboxylic acid acetyltransferase-like protein [Dinothrombium tinctorium]|uniref:L-azetidine-2-carboxylic acid acetyltransferase-like protein n=1 Tax=Dinothrombium tinctorium TaxID=1965070 RepID=A0A443R4G1_9ACAR|nr:L-azetidine-2-carboxylic acid acetyltransferase-like protein [Dinothrombium tinctorium]
MTSAYVLDSKRKKKVDLSDVYEKITLKIGECLEFDVYREEDFESLYEIFVEVVNEGVTFPQDSVDEQSFEEYFLSHYCFVLRSQIDGKCVAGIYIKPNFPGRSSHIANGGMVVRKDYRSKGLGDLLMRKLLTLSRKLEFEAVYSNLVFATNMAIIKLAEKHGLSKVGRLPKAGKLKGLGYVDAIQFYKKLND